MTDRTRRDREEAALRRLGIRPAVADLVQAEIERALARAEAAAAADGRALPDGPPAITALDAGCGRASALARHRGRVATLVGVDIHEPEPGSMPYLDAFTEVDVCASPDAFAPGSFDVILSSFTAEHFGDPAAAFASFAGWLRPGGTLVVTTVNRRHPFVAAYLSLPGALVRRLQPLVKASPADAHPLVGACNDPAAVRAALAGAGFVDIRLATTGHLARAWHRRRSTFLLGTVGDLLARGIPSRRSTIVATARVPAVARAGAGDRREPGAGTP